MFAETCFILIWLQSLFKRMFHLKKEQLFNRIWISYIKFYFLDFSWKSNISCLVQYMSLSLAIWRNKSFYASDWHNYSKYIAPNLSKNISWGNVRVGKFDINGDEVEIMNNIFTIFKV